MPKDPSLNVYDPNSDQPSEPPPSYEEAMADPQIDIDSTANTIQTHQRPSVPVTQGSSQQYQQQNHQEQQLTLPTLPQRPPATPSRPTDSKTQDLYTNNLNLPWRYPRGYFCQKCKNTGYKRRDKKCRRCWEKFGPMKPAASSVLSSTSSLPSSSSAYYQQGVSPMNPAVIKLPPGAIYGGSNNPNNPTVVLPGDPRIGGRLCSRCQGRGQVHFFLDLETCPVCNGLGRTP